MVTPSSFVHPGLRCPRCFGRELRKGESDDLHSDDMLTFSTEMDISQCLKCGWSGDEDRFRKPPRGCAVISPWTEAVA